MLYSFELAERLGMLQSELMERITARELAYWIARDEVYTSDAWIQTALIAYAASNAFGKGPKLKDFLPKRRKPAFAPERPMTDAELEEAFLRFGN